jgi:hypothetical protein
MLVYGRKTRDTREVLMGGNVNFNVSIFFKEEVMWNDYSLGTIDLN